MSGIDIMNTVSFIERRTGKIRPDLLYPGWLYLSDGFHESAFRNAAKRVFDTAVVLLLLPIALPLMLLVSIAILTERGYGDQIKPVVPLWVYRVFVAGCRVNMK